MSTVTLMHDDAIAVGDRIRSARAEAGITQQELAYRSHLAIRTVAKAETEGTGSVVTLRAIAGALGLTVSDLIGDARQAS